MLERKVSELEQDPKIGQVKGLERNILEQRKHLDLLPEKQMSESLKKADSLP